MQLLSSTLIHDKPLPAQHALGVASPAGPVVGDNLSPHLAWRDAPDATKSFVLLCVDPDAPASKELVNRQDVTVPNDFPRADFIHWVLINIPATCSELAEGLDARGLTVRGKALGGAAVGLRGLNDYTGWFAGDADMQGDYAGYDGAWPPFNDERVHRYIFTVYALDVPALALSGGFTAADVQAAMQGHVLAQASITTHYTLNPAIRLS